MSLLFAVVLAQLASPPGAAPALAFPGQWAPPSESRYPSTAKSCWVRKSDPVERSACLESVVRDFARLGRYAQANEALGPARDPRRVVFFGDSITDNWSKPGYGGFFPGKRYVNRGIGGQTTGQLLLRFRADVLALSPRAVVILVGTNDLAGTAGPAPPGSIIGNLATMVELAGVHKIRVVLASLLPVLDGKPDPEGKPTVITTDRPPAEILRLNREIQTLARKHGAAYLDYHRALAGPDGAFKPELTDDGLHPNAAGYAVMAPLAEAAIRKLLR
jgi:lysophospholipase L1-like esterase